MSRTIPFVKVAGAGNDFILLDRRSRPLSRAPAALAREWCDRKRSVGADGLLLVQASRRGNARMRIFNPDGSEAGMCGNGLRCVAWYLYTRTQCPIPIRGGTTARRKNDASCLGNGHDLRQWRIETGAGVLQAQITGEERVRIFFAAPRDLRLGLAVAWGGKRHALHAVDTGVPHAVIIAPRLETVDLGTLGPFIRRHRIFKPRGANVNLLRIHSPHRASIRTYERGVEQETMACGTGAVASVVIGAALGRLRPPVQVTTAGGEKMTVGFGGGARINPGTEKGLYLEGSARILFEGGVPL